MLRYRNMPSFRKGLLYGLGMYAHYAEKPIQRLYNQELSLREVTYIARVMWEQLPEEVRLWWAQAETRRRFGNKTDPRPPPFSTYGMQLPAIERRSYGFGNTVAHVPSPCYMNTVGVGDGDGQNKACNVAGYEKNARGDQSDDGSDFTGATADDQSDDGSDFTGATADDQSDSGSDYTGATPTDRSVTGSSCGGATPSDLSERGSGIVGAPPTDLSKTGTGVDGAAPADLSESHSGFGGAAPTDLNDSGSGFGGAPPADLFESGSGFGSAAPADLNDRGSGLGCAAPGRRTHTGGSVGGAAPADHARTGGRFGSGARKRQLHCLGMGMYAHYAEKPIQRLYKQDLSLRDVTYIARRMWEQLPDEVRDWWAQAETRRRFGNKTEPRPPPFSTKGMQLPTISGFGGSTAADLSSSGGGHGGATPGRRVHITDGSGGTARTDLSERGSGVDGAPPADLSKTGTGVDGAAPGRRTHTGGSVGGTAPADHARSGGAFGSVARNGQLHCLGMGMYAHYAEKPIQRLYKQELSLREVTYIARVMWEQLPDEVRDWWAQAETRRRFGNKTEPRPPPFSTKGMHLPTISGFGGSTAADLSSSGGGHGGAAPGRRVHITDGSGGTARTHYTHTGGGFGGTVPAGHAHTAGGGVGPMPAGRSCNTGGFGGARSGAKSYEAGRFSGASSRSNSYGSSDDGGSANGDGGNGEPPPPDKVGKCAITKPYCLICEHRLGLTINHFSNDCPLASEFQWPTSTPSPVGFPPPSVPDPKADARQALREANQLLREENERLHKLSMEAKGVVYPPRPPRPESRKERREREAQEQGDPDPVHPLLITLVTYYPDGYTGSGTDSN